MHILSQHKTLTACLHPLRIRWLVFAFRVRVRNHIRIRMRIRIRIRIRISIRISNKEFRVGTNLETRWSVGSPPFPLLLSSAHYCACLGPA